MPRRTFISKTAINRLVSASNRYQKEMYNRSIIESQGGNEKERPPHYSVNKIDFNPSTRVTRIEILQKQQYRTIQRYITQNYTKYPIYSEWKTKQKIVKKTLKLTNLELEHLNLNEDNLIRLLADEIIIGLNNEELYPSWFIKSYLNKQLEENIKNLDDNLKMFNEEKREKIEFFQKIICDNNLEIEEIEQLVVKITKKLNKKQIKLEKILLSKPNIYKMIFTLGIYYFLTSSKRKEKLQYKIELMEANIKDMNFKISCQKTNIKRLESEIEKYKDDIVKKNEEYEKKKEDLTFECENKIYHVEPLLNTIENNESFIMLKNFVGLEYEKVTGCYIIHNKEKDKYYVGQSKDVYKRLKQHFKGTVPNNPIFAEDYYTSKVENKNELFEVKIIKCETKDELDSLEKKLILEYDSWNNGYNRTSGNI